MSTASVEGDNITRTGSSGGGMTTGSVKANGDVVIGKGSAGGSGGTESEGVDITTVHVLELKAQEQTQTRV